mgnify:CR=1 FL=1
MPNDIDNVDHNYKHITYIDLSILLKQVLKKKRASQRETEIEKAIECMREGEGGRECEGKGEREK